MRIAVAQQESCVIDSLGPVCWGDDQLGELGDGQTTGFSNVPVAVAQGGLVQISPSGAGAACGVASDGSAYCWGDGSSGDLERFPCHATNTSVPSTVIVHGDMSTMPPTCTPLQSVTSVSAGNEYACALSNSKLYCWGNAVFAPNTTDTLVPLLDPVGNAVAARAVSAGPNFPCAIETDGSILCWSTSTTSAGIDIGGPAIQIAVGTNFACALRQDNTIWCWGGNDQGQLGQGHIGGPTQTDPVQVMLPCQM
jgi:alpha-tubulin suppressor-like RCC1 family protein